MKTALLAISLLTACGGAVEGPASAVETPSPQTEPTPEIATADAAHGAEVLAQNCTSCHGTEVYTRDDRRVRSASQLEGQVEACGRGAELDATSLADVTAHLNQEFYKF